MEQKLGDGIQFGGVVVARINRGLGQLNVYSGVGLIGQDKRDLSVK